LYAPLHFQGLEKFPMLGKTHITKFPTIGKSPVKVSNDWKLQKQILK
jgi:hypothetical protein